MLAECVDIYTFFLSLNNRTEKKERARVHDGNGWRTNEKESAESKEEETISLKAYNVRNNCENNAIYKSFYDFYFLKLFLRITAINRSLVEAFLSLCQTTWIEYGIENMFVASQKGGIKREDILFEGKWTIESQ